LKQISQNTRQEDLQHSDISLFVAALKRFSFFQQFSSFLKEEDWVYLGLSCIVEEFSPLTAICITGYPADCVYFNLNGKIAITRNRERKLSTPSELKTIFSFLPGGSSFGELGVLYNINRYIII